MLTAFLWLTSTKRLVFDHLQWSAMGHVLMVAAVIIYGKNIKKITAVVQIPGLLSLLIQISIDSSWGFYSFVLSHLMSVWGDIANTRKTVKSGIQTPQSGLKNNWLRLVSQLTSWCLDILMKLSSAPLPWFWLHEEKIEQDWSQFAFKYWTWSFF